ncbi:hypothetical protein [Paenibacillus tarimensis]|uniref:hypothetical protein n=1 Tax=Paenibacillus tarimensis TaxID=416012 RepID=UPI001F324E79|nr:hypothetical protein [Paenibacillus tarimensis]MCF2945269.1 hypothetical protein [Paenibacillus tarimensis]
MYKLTLTKLAGTALLALLVSITAAAEAGQGADSGAAEGISADASRAAQYSASYAAQLNSPVPMEFGNLVLYESPVNEDAKVEFSETKDSNLTSVRPPNAERRVYIHSVYTIARLQPGVREPGELSNHMQLLSAAKGASAPKLDADLSISAAVQADGVYDPHLLELVRESLTGNPDGVMTKTWTAADEWPAIPEDSPHNSRSYYGAVDHELYDVTVVQTDLYDQYIGTVYQGRSVEETGRTVIHGVKKPLMVSFSLDASIQ